MIKDFGENMDYRQNVLNEMKSITRECRRSNRTYKSLNDILAELRYRRKYLLGTDTSLSELVCVDGLLNQERSDILVDHLTKSTLDFWGNPADSAEDFVRLFYRLSILAIADPNLDSECLDDIIRLGTLLTHDVDLYEHVMKTFLSYEHYPVVYKLTEDFPDTFYSGMFEDAVFKAIACFTGALEERKDSV